MLHTRIKPSNPIKTKIRGVQPVATNIELLFTVCGVRSLQCSACLSI